MKQKLLWIVVAAVSLCALYGVGVIRRGFSARENPSAVESFIAKRARAMSVPMSARRMTNPVPDDDVTVKEGMRHFADHCASCHSNDGSGETEIGQSLYPRAPDMRQQPTQALSDGEIYYIIQNGIRLSGMPAWGKSGYEHDAETWALVRFIRRLPSVSGEQVRQMQQWNPVSREEQAEDQDEENFLSSQDAPSEGRKNMKKGK